LRFKQFKNIAELKKVERLIKEKEAEGNVTELMKYMKLHKMLVQQKKEFARTIGNVVYRPVT
jgi:hypothetical protein